MPAPAPGPDGATRFLRLLAPAPAPLTAPALAPQVQCPCSTWQRCDPPVTLLRMQSCQPIRGGKQCAAL